MLYPKTDLTKNPTTLRPNPEAQAFLYHQPIDMRKSINGLSVLVESTQIDILMNGAIFVFYNHHRDKIKLLYWERNGFILWYKRLEKHRFKCPEQPHTWTPLTGQQLNQLLDGLDIFQQPHPTLFYDNVS